MKVFDWQLQHGQLSFHYQGKQFWWAMPEGYELPSLRVRRLAEILILSPYTAPPPPVAGEQLDPRCITVAFSGGVDSAAAYELLRSATTDIVPVHTKVANPAGMHKVENAILATRAVNGLVIESNIDTFGTLYGRSRGFYGDAGWTVTGVLLSEHLQSGVQVDGNIIDTVYLWSGQGHGTKYNHRTFDAVRKAFSTAGMAYGNPCGGLSEVLTSRIAKGHEYAMGCMRGEGGSACLECLKCFRKSALRGEPIPSNPETDRKLSKQYVPMLAELLWADRQYGPIHPRLQLATQDTRWVESWFPRAVEHIPEELLGVVLSNIWRHGIPPLEDDSAILSWDSLVPFGPVDGRIGRGQRKRALPQEASESRASSSTGTHDPVGSDAPTMGPLLGRLRKRISRLG